MDTVLLFALPLVGGLIFCSTWNFTRWRVAREDGHRLYFRAVLFGAILFAVVAALRHQFEAQCPQWLAMVVAIKGVIKPMAKDAAGAAAVSDLAITCFLVMLLGWPFAKSLNLVFRKRFWLRRAIAEDQLEDFLLQSVDRELPIAATMDDGKIYVGYVVAGFDPAIGRKCILLLPLMSGYREKDTHKVIFTTYYTELYGDDSILSEGQLPEPLSHLSAGDFITVLPADRIASYRLFDAIAYQVFQKPDPPEPPEYV
jgi:hypothetical protein